MPFFYFIFYFFSYVGIALAQDRLNNKENKECLNIKTQNDEDFNKLNYSKDNSTNFESFNNDNNNKNEKG